MSSPNREENLSKFMEITNMSRVTATKLMDESDWDVDVSILSDIVCILSNLYRLKYLKC